MSNKVIVHKDRTNVIQINMGIDVSDDTITSEIRSEPSVDSPLLAIWTVDFLTDGTDGKLVLTLDNSITQDISASSGYMDLKRVVSGEPMVVFDRPLEVDFRGVVTE
jgi:hypothetical protein